MSTRATDQDVRALLRRAEQALRASRPRDQIVRLLEELAALADEGSEPSRFAHRHLAELHLEAAPWRAALHLRRVLAHDRDDDVALALMGLCQALLANFRSAVASYRRALAVAPQNPWYNHNLGHLLDVALDASRDALPYLRRAHRMEPSQPEVAASLAHCLGRVGACEEGLAIARGLAGRNPHDADLRALVAWLEQGAPRKRDATVPGLLSALPTVAGRGGAGDERALTAAGYAGAERGGPDALRAEIERVLVQHMTRAGHDAAEVARACRLWKDYLARGGVPLGRAGGYAAAVEYALAKVDGGELRQRDVAARYGVSVSAVQGRYSALRAVLALTPRDPRYAGEGSARAPKTDA